MQVDREPGDGCVVLVRACERPLRGVAGSISSAVAHENDIDVVLIRRGSNNATVTFEQLWAGVLGRTVEQGSGAVLELRHFDSKFHMEDGRSDTATSSVPSA